MVLQKIRKVLESFWVVPVTFAVAFICRLLDITVVSVVIAVALSCCTLALCKDVKNVLAIVFYGPFYIKNVRTSSNEILLTVAIVILVVALLMFTIYKLITFSKQKTLKKGALYIPFAVATVGYLLGGIGYSYKLSTAVTVLMLCLATFCFYFICLNCTQNLGRFMCKVFIVGAVFVSLLIMYENYLSYGDILSIFKRNFLNRWVGSENINDAALFILLGVCGAFYLGYKTERDGIFLIVATVLCFFIMITYCRTAIALAGLTMVTFTVLSFVKSPDKKRYAVYLGSCLLAGAVIIAVCWNIVYPIISALADKRGGSGRELLWPWCIEKFKEAPVFGIGFKYYGEGGVPSVGEGKYAYVLAHNTILQWLCSLGVVGTVAMLFFTVCKYRIIEKDFKGEGFLLRLTIIFFALSGVFDQSVQMDPFIYNIIMVLIASVEMLSLKAKPEKQKKENVVPVTATAED